jgi:hypothetical protein
MVADGWMRLSASEMNAMSGVPLERPLLIRREGTRKLQWIAAGNRA